MTEPHAKRPIVAGDIVCLARGWIGTPYHHQSSVKGVGTDCLGLVRGVYRELFGFEAEIPPAYSRDWAEANGTETMLDAARRHLVPVEFYKAGPGSVIVFRLRPGMVAKHTGIVASAGTMIHATEGAPVSEVALTRWWRRRMAAAFDFPGVVR
jgi:NlpC/P60 family putative phage cell wall peptidase